MELEYFEEAVEYLLSRPEAIPDRCGVVAICLGASYALAMGTFIDKVKAVFLINAPSAVYSSKILKNGEQIVDAFPPSSKHMTFDDQDRARLNPEMAKEWMYNSKYKIPIELSSPDTFYSFNVGEDDSFLAPIGAAVLTEKLDKAGMRRNYEYELYKGAGHIIEPPYSARVDHVYQNTWPKDEEGHRGPADGIIFYWGGNAKSDSAAQISTWNKMKKFLMNRVRDNSEWYQNYLKQFTMK